MAAVTRARWSARLDVVVAVSAALAWVSSASIVAGPRSASVVPRLWAAFVDVSPLATPPALAVIGLVVLAASVSLALGRARAASEATLLVSLHVAAVVEASVRGTAMSSVEPLLIGQVLLARLVARAITRRSAGDPERLGHEIACGVVGAAFFVAALAKLRAAGLGWAAPASHVLLVYERRESVLAPLTALREWLVAHPALVGAGALGSLLVELAGPLFVWPRARVAWAIAAAAMFASFAVVLGVVQITWGALPLALALLAPPPENLPPPEARHPPPTPS